jgi:hypothetical protein
VKPVQKEEQEEQKKKKKNTDQRYWRQIQIFLLRKKEGKGKFDPVLN